MSASSQVGTMDSGSMAQVDFRVRCESLGHGEDVFLVPEGDEETMQKKVPLYTTAASYPWYQTLQSLTLSLATSSSDNMFDFDKDMHHDNENNKHQSHFRYRYAVYRAGKFFRWEALADVPSDLETSMSDSHNPNLDQQQQQTDHNMATEDEAPLGMDLEEGGDVPQQNNHMDHHHVPLRLFSNRHTYVVNDVLGKTTGHPDIDHNRLIKTSSSTNMLGRGMDHTTSAASLHSRTSSFGKTTNPSLGSLASNKTNSGTALNMGGIGSAATKAVSRKKAVGFAPPPPKYQRPKTATAVQAVHLNSSDGLVVVSAFLPVVLHRSDEGQWTADWDYEALLSMQTHLRVTRIGVVKWRGWHGNTGKFGSSPEAGVPDNEQHLVEECLRPFNCVPVWMETTLFGEMYNGFCKGVLWPILHNSTNVYAAEAETTQQDEEKTDPNAEDQYSEYCMDDVEQGPIHGGRGREKELWSSYNTVNRKFADVVVQYFNEGDLVWIHGFHLLILPSYLTRRIPMAKVGLFLHTPFPSSEIFRTVWCREDLLRGMLNADQVGFHLYEYARHFLTCCRRLLGLNYGMIPDASGGHTLAIDMNGRHVSVTSIHAGIEPPVLSQILNHDATMGEVASIRARFAGKTIFCAIDRMESLKGIPLKLLGVERFLNHSPEWVGKIVLIQLGISAFERGDDYSKTKDEIAAMVTRINSLWPGTIQFEECSESSMRLQQRMALMRAADVVLVTPIRDGLNLIPLEFTIAHQDALTPVGQADGRRRGLCILSEFASCTRVMRGALHVNPWKISEIANAFHQALHMSEDERMRRIRCACEFVTRVTTQRWALAVMLDLKGVHKSINPIQYSGAGLGLGYHLLSMDVGFVSLDFSKVAKAFKNARSRLVLLDYGGTITINDNIDALARFKMVKERKAHSEPTPEMLRTIRELCADKRNTVFVVSGKERHSLTKVLNDIPNLGLAAEHGMYISWPTRSAGDRRQWETLVPIVDRAWRSMAMAIMEVYTSRTHGSYIEETEMKVLWQYRDADLEFGYLQARELEDHLSNCLRSFPVDILHGGMEEGGYVEVRPKGVNKGVLAMKVIQNCPQIAQTDRFEFALSLGDDHCDEPMLSVMRQIGRRVHDARRVRKGEDPLPDLPSTMTLVDVSGCDEFLAPNLDVYTCTVGKKPSAAANYLNDVTEVQELLDALVKVSARDNRFSSDGNLEKFDVVSSTEGGRFSLVSTATTPTNPAKGMGRSSSWAGHHQAGGGFTPSVPNTLVDYLGAIDDVQGDDSDDNFF